MKSKIGRVIADIGSPWLYRDPTKALRFKGGRLQQAFKVHYRPYGERNWKIEWFDVASEPAEGEI